MIEFDDIFEDIDDIFEDIDDDFEDFEEGSPKDELMLAIGKMVKKELNADGVVDPSRVLQLLDVYKSLCRAYKNTNVKVSYKLYEPFVSVGSVSIVGKSIPIMDKEVFEDAIRLSSNFEMYPKTDGTIKMTFTFHGLVDKI